MTPIVEKRIQPWLPIIVGLFLTGAAWCFWKAGAWAIQVWSAGR